MKLMFELVKLADLLDQKGLMKEATMIDDIIRTAKLPPFLEKCPGCSGAMKKGSKMCKKCLDKKKK